jgi:putative ATPase
MRKNDPNKQDEGQLPLIDEPAAGAEVRPPLAERMRSRDLDEFFGQDHIVGEGKPLRRMIASGKIPSLILWGPPGSGKTTLAHIIARILNTQFIYFSAVLTGIKEVRDVMSDAAYFFDKTSRQTVIFIDEIHRFNKAQQDAFLPFLEKGQVLLIGTTTVNPSFDLNAALLSRMKVFTLRCLEVAAIERILRAALADAERGLGGLPLDVPPELLHKIALFASGDARRGLNLLEQLAVYLEGRTPPGERLVPTHLDLTEVLQQKTLLYDRDGEEHYNMLSALHKSMRDSNPDAAVYWAVRMLESGEDPRNICRRVLQCASEDVGLADNQALQVAVQAWQAYELLGLPEGRLAILQAAVYVAVAPKSNSLLRAYLAAREDVQTAHAEPVPLHLRNAPTALMRREGYGDGYLYAHDYPEGTTDMTCLPPDLAGRTYYHPSTAGIEARIRDKMKEIQERKQLFASRREGAGPDKRLSEK